MILNKRITSFIIAALLALSMAACGGAPSGVTTTAAKATETAATTTTAAAKGDGTTAAEAESTAATTATTTATATTVTTIADTKTENVEINADGDGPLTPYKETIKLTWAVQAAAVQKFFDGDTYDNNRWSRKIKDDLNIDVEVAFSADASTDAYQNKMNAVLASGDLPDIMRWGDRNFFAQAHEAGYLADITDVFFEYATAGLKSYLDKYPDSFEGASVYGRLFAFPYMNDNFHQAPYLWIRDDWLENTGSKPPATIDEMVALARKFTFDDPDGNGKNDTYGLALNKRIVQTNYGTICGLIGAFGVPGYGAGGIFYFNDENRLTFANIQPEMKDALALVRDMYAEGLIDPEFVVKDTANMEQDVVSGKFGMTYHMNWGTWHPFNLLYERDKVIARPYPIPTIPGVEYKIGINSNKTGDLFMLNSKCKNPEAFIKILNLYNKTCIETTEADDFLTYWSDEQYRLCPVYVGIPTPELFADVLFEALNKGTPDGLPANLRQVYSYVVDFESGKNTDPNAYGTWGQMNKRGSMIIAMEDYKGHIITNIMANQRPDIWLQNASILETLLETTFTDIITGAKPIDEFDKFVGEWLSNGGQQTLNEIERSFRVN